jgi:hypothetical protein
VAEAADALGVTVDAVRSRIKRGTIAHERKGARVYVLLGADEYDTGHDQGTDQVTDQPRSDSGALISELRARVSSLEYQLEQERQANSEHRRLLAAALERIPPQLEAPQEARESPETARGEPEGAGHQSAAGGAQEGVQRRPWWRRMFGG